MYHGEGGSIRELEKDVKGIRIPQKNDEKTTDNTANHAFNGRGLNRCCYCILQ